MIKRTLHTFLALLIFLSSAGILVNKHFCREELKSVALFVKATPCHQKKATSSCPFHTTSGVKVGKKGCCEDHADFYKSDHEQRPSNLQLLKVPQPQVALLSSPSQRLVLIVADKRVVSYLNYKPPLLRRTEPDRLQRFLC